MLSSSLFGSKNGKERELLVEEDKLTVDFFNKTRYKWEKIFLVEFDVTNKGENRVSLLHIDPFVKRYTGEKPRGKIRKWFDGSISRLLGFGELSDTVPFIQVIGVEGKPLPEIGIRTFPPDRSIDQIIENPEVGLDLLDVKPGFDGISNLKFYVEPGDTKTLQVGIIFDCYKEGERKAPKEGLETLIFNFRVLFDNGQEHEFLHGLKFDNKDC